MARLARVIVPQMPHHVTQRGNRRQQTFFNEGDYRAYLELMREWSIRHGLRVWSYCLMPNHVHLILVPPSEEALCRGVGEAHRRYTRRVNFREGWRGHLWQGRFASFVMDEPYLIAAARYIERNPVRAKLVKRAKDWPWSSAAAHVTGRADPLAEVDWLFDATKGWTCTWGEYLRELDEPKLGRQLHCHENTGRPMGEESFLKRLEKQLGRSLIPGKGGRPRKKDKN
jgi:putative transposase